MASEDSDSSPSQINDAWRTLELVNTWVFHAEVKLGVTLAYLGALFAGLIAILASLEEPSELIMNLSMIAALFLLVGVLSAAAGLLPRFKASKAGNNPIYYRDIAEMEFESYERRFRATSVDSELLTHLTQQIRAISGVAIRKYRFVHAAIVFGALALIATGIVGFGLFLGW